MAPVLIIVALLALGVGIVAWATRRVHGWSPIGSRGDAVDRTKPISAPTSAWSRREPSPETPSEDATTPAHDPFAHAPRLDTLVDETPVSKENRA